MAQTEVECLAAASGLMREQRWSDADAAFAAAPDQDRVVLQRNICRNFEAMRRHRAGVYSCVINNQGQTPRYVVGPGAQGQRTIYFQQPGQPPISLSIDSDPALSLTRCLEILADAREATDGIALLGIGDGFVLNHLARNPPEMAFDREQPIILVEPDPQAALAALMLHDYSGPGGPIEQERFAWIIGASWTGELSGFLLAGQSENVFPKKRLQQSVQGPAIKAGVEKIISEVFARQEGWQRDTQAYYAALGPEHWREIFSAFPPRKPRALFLTTRFSTVLHHSTRACAEGLESLGWETQTFIESTRHQPLSFGALVKIVLDFRPDLIVQIDHLRGEWGFSLPPEVPFVCWAQDHLPNLTRVVAGQSITPRDFIFTGMPALYTDRFSYPAAQCFHMARLTRSPLLPAKWESEGDDLTYVSNHSLTPDDRVKQIFADTHAGPDGEKFLEAFCRNVLAVYERGGWLGTPPMVLDILGQTEKETRIVIPDASLRQKLADVIFDRFSNLLYRQQALGWARDIAQKHGLKLGIYGEGWEKNPAFAAFARGPVAYGTDLDVLARQSRINLVLEPYFTPSHQRLLDAIMAGGFCLVRDHPSHSLFEELAHFLCARLPSCPQNIDEARHALSGEDRAALDDILRRWDAEFALGDAVAYVHGALESGKLLPHEPTLPHLREVCFSNPVELEQRILEFVAAPEKREAIRRDQRQAISGRLSYAAGMRRIVDQVAAAMVREAEQPLAIAA